MTTNNTYFKKNKKKFQEKSFSLQDTPQYSIFQHTKTRLLAITENVIARIRKEKLLKILLS